ncbi:MAG: hypothetical protein JSV43_03380 [Methanobacteriota archaeon]|nr:MAG: hypothetical protein JSV43_03380 [Euryarchaeota archaeon]
MKIAFHPHIVGYGHRVRCNLIAKEIVKLRANTKIVFLDRRDDPLYKEDWTPFKRVHGGFRRTLSSFTSSCLVEDCAMIEDFRRRWRAITGKIVTILNPTFRPEFSQQKHHLRHTDLIIICYPEGFFPFPKILEDFREKIAWFGPVLNLPGGDFQRRTTGRLKANILLSRGRKRLIPLIRELAEDLGFEILETSFKSEQEYFNTLSQSSFAVTQGTTAVFECSQLGIPQVCLPINEEQLVVAKRFSEAGGLKYLPLQEASSVKLKELLVDVVADAGMRAEMARKAREFTCEPGQHAIAKAILKTVRGSS